jgi:uncharacterized protein YbbK (DUF523 family)/uncharacterized protein YbgA (DUF1722 family)
VNSSGLGEPRIRIGVSACLLGHEVRFDGGHKRDTFIVEVLGRFAEFVPVCPEVEIGLGVPRETLKLAREGREVRLVANESGADHTRVMRAYAERRVTALAREDLCGYVLKKDSPSCGLERVRVYPANGRPSRDGRGLFAEALMHHLPNLPVEEEGRLSDPRLRENFIERIFAYQRLRTFFAGRWSVGRLAAFHTRHKLQLMAHSARAWEELGHMAVATGKRQRAALRAGYEGGFMRALSKPATPARHTIVLRHIASCLHDRLDPDARRELIGVIDDYRNGLAPLIVPITLARHHARQLRVEYLDGQVYLEPHPQELMLRNHV